MASDPYRVKEPDTCSHCGADATRMCEDGERYCEHCLPPVRLVPVHEDAALRERAAALEVALTSLLETVPTCGHDDCHRDAFTSVRVDGRTPSNPGGWYRAWFCDEHIPTHVSERMSLNRMRAAVEAIREMALLGAGEGAGG